MIIETKVHLLELYCVEHIKLLISIGWFKVVQ
jgi:hypothetical protein